MMDITDVSSLVGSLRSTLGLFKDAREMLPKGKNKEKIGELISEAEEKATAVEAELAVKLEYQICRGHWPPVVMLESKKRFIFTCPDCGKEVDTGPASISVAGSSKSRFRRSLDNY